MFSSRYISFLCYCCCCCCCDWWIRPAQAQQPEQPPRVSPRDAALSFLSNQIDARTGLLDSYVEDDAPFLYTYDQAMAALAWMSVNDMGKARLALRALANLPRDNDNDGGLYHRYSTVTGRPTAGANVNVGHAAYVLQAFNEYYAKTGGDTRYFAVSEQVANFLMSRQDSPNQGIGNRQVDGDGGLFGSDQATWKSTENNLAAYVALHNFAKITNNAALASLLQRAANDIRSFLLTECWDATEGRFLTGKNDDMVSTDVNALGVMVFGYQYASALDFVENHTQHTMSYDNSYITGFDLNDDKDTVWMEGTLQMSIAYAIASDNTKANASRRQAMKLQHPSSGAFLQANVEGTTGHAENFHPWQAVSPTAWFILATRNVNPLLPWP